MTRAAQLAGLGSLEGSAPAYACRAWVNFNGTGTVTIRASGNVSSITDNGTGDYTVNFTTAMPDANYCGTVTAFRAGSGNVYHVSTYQFSASNIRFTVRDVTTFTVFDVEAINVDIFR